jgi:hypothetical protein
MATKAKQEEVAAYSWENYDGNTGLEHLSSKDLGIPILQIIQKGSAEFDEDHEDHATKAIAGVKVGDIINSVTRQILHTTGGQPVKVVPYFYQLVWVEWREKNNGGGIAQTHTSEAILNLCTRNDKNKDVLPNGNYVSTTAYFFVRILQEGQEPQDALIAMSSTQLKKSRLWLNMMKNFRAGNGNTLPMFHRAYYLTTIGESNAKGTWRGWKIEPAPTPLTDNSIITNLIRAVSEANRNATALIGNSPTADEDIV